MARKRTRFSARKRWTRDSYDRVLIVAEGTKTEPQYFRELVNEFKLNTANIEVIERVDHGNPRNVVRQATERSKFEKQQGDPFDRVYCVFDRDSHSTFASASSKAETNGLRLARSWPCFEYWLLLHFEYVRSPFDKSGRRSECDNCVRRLEQHIPKYGKAMKGVFRLLEDKLEQAKANARMALDDAFNTNEPNPSTEVHELVEYLQSLKRVK